MKHSNTKLYRTPHKTQQSRSIRITLNSGFTLIELLVVVAIISLLTTIVLGAISDARVKARNSAKNSLVMEYIKALELYRNDHGGSYPVTTSVKLVSTAIPVCIGYANEEPCFNNRFGADELKNIFQTYFSGEFADTSPIIIDNKNYKGIVYDCLGAGGSCNKYTLMWILEKNISNCISNASKSIPNNNSTLCIYPESN